MAGEFEQAKIELGRAVRRVLEKHGSLVDPTSDKLWPDLKKASDRCLEAGLPKRHIDRLIRRLKEDWQGLGT